MPFVPRSCETCQYTRIVEIPKKNWALATSPEHQELLESRKRLRGDQNEVERRRPFHQWASFDIRIGGAVNGHVDRGRPLQDVSEHDHLAPGSLVFVLGAVTSGCTSASDTSKQGLSVRIASWPYLEKHVRVRLQHVVLQLQAVCPVDLGASAFLRGCAPLGGQLIERGVCDYRVDGFLDALHDAEDEPYRIARINVGGVSYARWPRNDAVVSDTLFICIVADVYNREEDAGVALDPAISQWLERDATAIAYTPTEHAAYMEARRALLEAPANEGEPSDPSGASSATTATGGELRATNLRLVPTQSNFLWASGERDARRNTRDLRTKLGLRAAPNGAMRELVLGMWPVARVLETHVSVDGLLKVCMAACEYLEGDAVWFEN